MANTKGKDKLLKWLQTYDVEKRKGIDLSVVNEELLKEYAKSGKEIQKNAVFEDCIIKLKKQYQDKIVKEVVTIEELTECRRWLKVLTEIEMMIDRASQVDELYARNRGRKQTY